MRKENDVLWRHLDETLLGVNVFFFFLKTNNTFAFNELLL